MLAAEQIENLKPGDKLIAEVEFLSISSVADIKVKILTKNNRGADITGECFLHPAILSLPSEHGTSLSRRSSVGAETEVPTPSPDRTFCHVVDTMVKPKHNTCRPFKKGDKVRVDADLNEEVLTVAANQLNSSVTAIAKDGQVIVMPCYFLKLITPVEEIRPYSVLETDTISGFDIMRDGLCVMNFPYGSKEAGYYRDKLAAKAAAEAECKRLNEEHGKNQNNE